MSTYLNYISYFENLANEYLGHTSEEKHFFRKGLEEFLNGLQTSVNYPAMLLDSYDFKYNDNGADDVNKERTIAFLIIDNAADTEDYNRIDEIYNNTEAIIDNIFNRLRADMRWPKSEFVKHIAINNVQVSPVDNYADANFGYFVTIDILSHHNTTI